MTPVSPLIITTVVMGWRQGESTISQSEQSIVEIKMVKRPKYSLLHQEVS